MAPDSGSAGGSDGWQVPDRIERDLPESHTVLWTVIVVAAVFDVVTTMVGLAAGLEEGNRVARAFLTTYGDAGIGLLKFAALVALVIAWYVLPDREAELVLAGFAVISLLTVTLNALTLLSL
ncbi:DUF5658 family protein [Halorientalis halophila]|uniref:DUF5658 family protein n=1 Tax=Halorientalis halophila TaxID=3108499 RepID=UPI003009BF0D